MKPLKVMFIAPSDLPIPAVLGGGMEQLLQNIIEVNEREQKLLIQIITPFNKKAIALQKEFVYSNFINVKYSFYFKIYNLIFRNTYKWLKLDFFHYYLLKINRYISSLKPNVVIIWGNDEQILSISKVVPKEKLYYCQATLRFQNVDKFDLCNKIFIGSNHTINEINKASEYKLSEKLFRVQSAIDIYYFQNNFSELDKINTRKLLGFNNDYPIISYLGRIVESKGALALLNSALILKERGFKFNLLLLGNLGSGFGKNKHIIGDHENNKLQEKINKLKNSCVHTGFVKTELLPLYMSIADIGVVPSIVEDVSPLAYFQWQSMGISTVVSDAGGIPEFFSEDYSLMFKRGENMEEELANHLEDLINNPEVRIKMGQNALRMRPTLSKERYYKDIVNIVLS
jgi:glycosyltransferase involved in cell wall biosynthesis